MLPINVNRFLSTFHSLTNIGWTEEGVMRLALNEYDVKVREELIKILSSIGSIINVDDAGNIRGSIRGKSVDNIFTHLKYLHLLSPPYLTNTPGSKGCYR